MNRSPISVDEASITDVRLKRSGRQKGAWVYLDADLLRRAGIARPEAPLIARRYAMRDTRPGRRAIVAQIVLKVRYAEQEEPPQDGGDTEPGLLSVEVMEREERMAGDEA